MQFEIDSEIHDLQERGIEFAKQDDIDKVFDFLTSAFGALNKEYRDRFIQYAIEYHAFKSKFPELG